MKSIISVANKKGGVGKTTFSANVGYELSKLGFVTVVIDMDEQCDLTKLFLERMEDHANILSILEGKLSVKDVMVEIYDKFFLIPGSSQISYYKHSDKRLTLEEKLKNELNDEVDFVIVDTPAGTTETAIEAIKASTEILIIIEPDLFSIANLSHMLEDVEAIKSEFALNLNLCGVVINKVDGRRTITKHLMNELKKWLGDTLFDQWMSNDSAIPNSIYQSVPIRELKWRSRTVSQLNAITHEIIRRVEHKDDQF